ncbi:MAG: hypothetical protein ABSB74_05195 [Tepidisphaeraceae bacterium]
MERTDSPAQGQCWVDVFEADCFMGRMRRLVGPRKLRQLSAKSVIVGPHAMVVLTVRRRGRDCRVTLRPRKVIPNLAATVRGAKICNATVVLKK